MICCRCLPSSWFFSWICYEFVLFLFNLKGRRRQGRNSRLRALDVLLPHIILMHISHCWFFFNCLLLLSLKSTSHRLTSSICRQISAFSLERAYMFIDWHVMLGGYGLLISYVIAIESRSFSASLCLVACCSPFFHHQNISTSIPTSYLYIYACLGSSATAKISREFIPKPFSE